MCVCVCVPVCFFLDYVGLAEVLKMKVRVELMVVKGPSVYLVLVNMKYNLSLSLTGSGCVLLLWVSVVRSPLKAGFVCSHRSGSLGNLITRLKALSIRQITRSVCVRLCVYEWASTPRVCAGVYGQCVCACYHRLPTEHRSWEPMEAASGEKFKEKKKRLFFSHKWE